MIYNGFQRFDESQAYSKMRREQIESEAQERKEILDKCAEASQRRDEGNREAVEDLYQALVEYNNLRDEQKERKR